MGFPKRWYLLCWVALMQLGFVNAYASEDVGKKYKIGIAPSHVTTSPNSLLDNTSQSGHLFPNKLIFTSITEFS
jgi:hypothetical protein